MRVIEAGAKVAAKVAPKRTGVVLPPLKWLSSPNFSDRTMKIDMVVLHDMEGSYAGGNQWFHEERSHVSAHVDLREDGLEATQEVAYNKKAWHAAAFNSRSIGIEMGGVAAKGFGSSELAHAARMVAFFLHKYGLPPRYLTGSAVNSGRGFTLHQDLGAAGGGHHDPGFSAAKAKWFAALVAFEFHRGGFRPAWGFDSEPAV